MEKKFNCILLVDDDDTSNFLTQKVISIMGIADHTHTTYNGKQALTYLLENCKEYIPSLPACPDMILLDINMPVMDGFQFLEEFYKIQPDYYQNIKIVVLTSSENPKDLERFKKYPLFGYINKPISIEKLQVFSD
jgi:CheY-like chemotaxis protein